MEIEEFDKAEIGQAGVDTLEVEEDQGDQHEQGTHHGIDEELDCCIDLVLTTPDADYEVHRNQHDFPEDVKEEKVERDESSQHAGFQQQKANHVFLDLIFNSRPSRQNCNRHNECTEHE